MGKTKTKERGAQRSLAPQVVEDPGAFRGQIEALAHELWQARGCPEGTAEEDWYQAERMLVEKS